MGLGHTEPPTDPPERPAIECPSCGEVVSLEEVADNDGCCTLCLTYLGVE